jgi:hypothetical protein
LFRRHPCIQGLLNNRNILPVDPHVNHRESYEKNWSVQKSSSSPVLRPLEGKAAAAWTGGAYGGVREHGQAARTPLAAFFNTPIHGFRLCNQPNLFFSQPSQSTTPVSQEKQNFLAIL